MTHSRVEIKAHLLEVRNDTMAIKLLVLSGYPYFSITRTRETLALFS